MIPRRILLAVDASPDSLEAARTAIELAARSAAELVALFVDEHRLQEEAPGGALHGQALPRERSPRADRAVRRQVERLVGGRPVRLSFRSAEGQPAVEILRAVPDADLVVLGRVGWSGRRMKLGSTAAAVLSRGAGLLVPDVHHSDRVLVVVLHATSGPPAPSDAKD